MKKPLFLLLFSITTFLSFAQVDPLGAYNRHVVSNWNGSYMRVGNYHVKGNPYLFGESFSGTIDYKGGESVTGIKVLYDLYNQRAGIDLKNNEIFEAEAGVDRFVIDLPEKFGGRKLLFMNGDAFGQTGKKEYFNVLEDGSKVTFLKAYRIRLLPDPTNEMNREMKLFDQYFEYYIYQKGTKQLNKIKLKEKDILKEVNADQATKEKIKKGEIDLGNEAQVILFIKSYNSTQS